MDLAEKRARQLVARRWKERGRERSLRMEFWIQATLTRTTPFYWPLSILLERLTTFAIGIAVSLGGFILSVTRHGKKGIPPDLNCIVWNQR